VSQPKVVQLHPARKRAALSPVLQSLRQQTRKALTKLLEGLFNNVDDALFEMADRSHNDIDQHLFFDSMRELRLKRLEIADRFAAAFTEEFEKAFSADVAEPQDLEHVTMVDNDDLEISVAIAGIVSKVTSQHALPIMQLTRRLDHLAQEVELTERRNPLGPELLSRVFVDALSCADVDIKIRIILLKLYERFVMECLAEVYLQANQVLADAGVLADLKSIIRERRESETRHAEGAPGAAAAPDSTPERPREAAPPGPGRASTTSAGAAIAQRADGFQLIQSLLAGYRDGPAPAPSGGGAGPDVAHGAPTPGSMPVPRALSRNDVLQALALAQQALAEPIDLDTVPAPLEVRELVCRQAQDGDGPPSTLGRIENDVVDFVGMLFDYILNDHNLAVPMKALIGRLQLPIVRLAILDRSFFERTNHPARALLNELSWAGIGWSNASELARDAVYDKIESVVLTIVNDFREDVSIFERLLNELREFVGHDTRRRQQAEQRVKDSEQGRARTQDAKQQVQQLINQKASGMRLPADIGQFVSDLWSRVLVYSAIKDGHRSPRWHAHIQTLDDLLWCLQPLDNLKDIGERDARLPELLSGLETGMERIQIPASEAEKHLSVIQTQLERISANDRAYLEDDEAPTSTGAAEPEDPDAAAPELTELVLNLTEDDECPDAGLNVDDAQLARVGMLQEGNWVEFQDGAEVLRCKLTAITDPGGRYIFVNRRGMKVAEHTRRGLAAALQQNRLTILDESQVFDRALEAVIGNLRSLQRA
jgi:hypothetical protein